MMERAGTTEEGVVFVRVDGTLQREDFQQVEQWIDEAASHSPTGRAGIVIELKCPRGVPPRGVLEDIKLGLRTPGRDIHRVAVVAEADWLGAASSMFDPNGRDEIRRFDPEQRDEAIAWAAQHSTPGAVRL